MVNVLRDTLYRSNIRHDTVGAEIFDYLLLLYPTLPAAGVFRFEDVDTSSGTAGHHKRINEPVSGEALCTFRRQEVLSWETIARSYTCTRYEISFPLKKFLLPMGYVRYGSGVI